jgi:hypothetical protein
MERYTVFKSTGTHADVIAAVGAADVLRLLEPRLINCGDRFEVQVQRRALPGDLVGTDPGFLFLPRSGKRPAKLPDEWIFEAVTVESEIPGTSRASGSPVQRGKGIDPEKRMYTILGRLVAAGGPNKLVLEFVRMPRGAWLQRVWQGFQGGKEFVTTPRLVQLFNPHAARGYSLMKPAGTDRNDKSKNQWNEPFIEWLRYRGFFNGCAGWFLDKDIRVFCPVPGDLPYSLYREVVAAFRELRLAGSPPKIDCRAVIGLTLILIERMAMPVSPRLLIEAVFIAHYRNMGQANTLMSIGQLAVPDWFDLRTTGDIRRWRSTLLEHDTILKRLADNKSEEIALLIQYRRIFQGESEPALEAFVEFLADYGVLVFRRRAEDQRCDLPLFTKRSVEEILEHRMTYRQILYNPGFHAIAEALRAATVNALAARRDEVFNHRQVRYGVLSEIRRSIPLGKSEMLRTIFGFVADFNAETARLYQNHWHDARILEEDVAAFVALLDQAPSAEVVGSMLCAIATCRGGHAAVETAQIEFEQAVPA